MLPFMLALLASLASAPALSASVDRSALERLIGDAQVGYLFDDAAFAAANPPDPILPPMVRRVSRAAAMAEAAGLGTSLANASGEELSSDTWEEWLASADHAYCQLRYELAADSFEAYEQTLREYATAVAADPVLDEAEKKATEAQISSALQELDACRQAAES